MKKILMLLAVVAAGVGAKAQTIKPIVKSWDELSKLQVTYADGIKEVYDGSEYEREREKRMITTLPAGEPIIRSKPARGDANGGMTLLSTSPEPTVQFDGLSDGQLRSRATIPPDTYGAVGFNELMTVTNSEVVVRNKTTGATLGSIQGLDAFFSGVSFGGSAPNAFDPRIVYDPFSNRYIFVVCVNGGDVNNNGFIIAISQTSNPQGTWNFYPVDSDGSNTTWFDYPYLSFNKNKIYVSGSMFSDDDVYQRSKIYVFDKASLYAGESVVFNTNAKEILMDAQGINFCGVNDYDNTSDSMYVIQTWSGSTNGNSYLRMGAIVGNVPNVSYSLIGLVENEGVTYATSPGSIDFAVQTGGNAKINNGDSRMMNAQRINNSLYCAHTIFQPLGGPTYSSPEWFQLGLTGNIIQTGIIGTTPGQFRYYPSIVANKANDILIGYSVSNKDIWVSAAYSTRLAADPLGTVRTEYLFQEGRAYYTKTFNGTRNRWGDYSMSIVDPVNQSLWTVQEFASSPALINNQLVSMWGTWWANVAPSQNLDPLPVKLIAFNAQLAQDGASVNVTWTTTGESNIREYCVERSKDGIVFEKVGCVNAFNTSGDKAYQYTDKDPLFGASFYRLKTVEFNSRVLASEIRRIDRSQLQPILVNSYPNPARDQFNIRWYTPGIETFTVVLSNQSGQVVSSRQAGVTEGYYMETINTSGLAAGTYNVVLKNSSGWIKTIRFVKQ